MGCKKLMFASKIIAGIFLSILSQAIIADSSNTIIDAKRLLAAANETDNWLSFGRDYTNQNFSPLKQINATNVKKLVPKWIKFFSSRMI